MKYQANCGEQPLSAIETSTFSGRHPLLSCRRLFTGLIETSWGAPVESPDFAGLSEGWDRVQMPDALDRKYPGALTDGRRQWVFSQEKRWINPRTKEQGRHHVDESLLQKAVRDAVSKAGLTKQATSIDTLLPHSCWKRATTFERSGNCWAIARSRRRSCIPTSSIEDRHAFAARGRGFEPIEELVLCRSA